jgi:hypothetical protein
MKKKGKSQKPLVEERWLYYVRTCNERANERINVQYVRAYSSTTARSNVRHDACVVGAWRAT